MQKGTRSTNRESLRHQSEPEFPSREHRCVLLRASGRNTKKGSCLRTAFTALTHSALYFICFWILVFFLLVELKLIDTETYLVIVCIL